MIKFHVFGSSDNAILALPVIIILFYN